MRLQVTDLSGIIGRDWTKDSLESQVRSELALRGRKGTDIRSVAARLGALAELSHKFGPFGQWCTVHASIIMTS